MKKRLSLLLFLVFGMLLVTAGCKKVTTVKPTTASTSKSASSTTKSSSQTNSTSKEDETKGRLGIPYDVVGQVDILLWSGSDTYRADLGHSNLSPTDLVSQNDAAAYAVAKEFNKLYPNVIINGFFKSGDSGGTSNWTLVQQNYQDTHGVYPSIWASMDLPQDTQKGIVADLSRYKEDDLYKKINPSILGLTNYWGFQAGFPQYILPWGIYVNKSLANANNISIPDPWWTIEEYTEFASHYVSGEYYGAMDTPMSIITSGVTTMQKSLYTYMTTGQLSEPGKFVNMNSNEMRDLFPYIHEWNKTTFWGDWDLKAKEAGDGENPLQTMYSANGNWTYHFFRNNDVLTLESDPWMMGDCAEPDKTWWAACQMDDWDIYPRPATEYNTENIGIVLDPMALYNFCIDDKVLACSAEEQLKMDINYLFMSFWVADNRSFEARANQLFGDPTNYADDPSKTPLSSALNDSLPVVVGDDFDVQMNLWYKPTKHQRFADKDLMPGWHYVLELYQNGVFWDVSDKAFPWFYNYEGSSRQIMYEFQNYWDINLTGVQKGDSAFTSTILSRLEEWTDLANARFEQAFKDLQEGLINYYGFEESDFE